MTRKKEQKDQKNLKGPKNHKNQQVILIRDQLEKKV